MVDNVSVRFNRKNAFKHSYSHVGVRAKTLAYRGLRVGPSKSQSGKPRVRLSFTVGFPSRSALSFDSRKGFLSVDLVDKSTVKEPSGEHLARVQQYSWSPWLNSTKSAIR